MRKSIIDNIISLYRDIAPVAGADFCETGNLFWVRNSSGFWPDTIVGTPPSNGIERVVEKIDQGILPPFWLIANSNSVELEHQLKLHHFREVNRWEGMWLTSGRYRKSEKKLQSYVVQKVVDEFQLNDWWSVVKPVMMPNKNVDPVILKHWLKSDAYIMLAGYTEGETVSAGMAYTSNGIAGLYFIATLPQYQGHGYASALVVELIEKCFINGVDEIILHASNAGFKMYSQLGFEHDGLMSTYWKVGKF